MNVMMPYFSKRSNTYCRQIHCLLWVITRELVALYLELGYFRFREEPIQVVSVRITQRFAGRGGVRLI
jgi:hypothetical protein